MAAIFFLFFLGLPWVEPLAGTQLTYFPQALRVAGEPGYQHDWFANTTPTHPVFFAVAAAAERLGMLVPLNFVGSALVFAAGLLAVYLQGRWVHESLASRGWAFTRRITCGDFALLALLAAVTAFHLRQALIITFDEALRLAFAFQTIWPGFLFVNTSFALVIYLGLALLPFERFRLAGICLGIGAAFHVSYFLHAAIAVGVTSIWLLWHRRRGEVVAIAVPFALLTILPVAYGIWMRFGGEPESAGMFERLARERIAHHIFPEVFWRGNWNWIVAACLVMASLIMLVFTKGPLKWVFTLSTVYVLGGIYYVAQTSDIHVAYLFPWRAGTYLIPAAFTFLVLAGVAGTLALLETSPGAIRRVAAVALPVGMALVTIGSVALVRSHPNFTTQGVQETRAFAKAVGAATEPDAVIVIPEDWMAFRADARRAVYVDGKSHPFRRDELREWFARLERNRELFQLPHEARLARCLELSATHFAEEIDPEDAASLGQVLRMDRWALYRCDAAEES